MEVKDGTGSAEVFRAMGVHKMKRLGALHQGGRLMPERNTNSDKGKHPLHY